MNRTVNLGRIRGALKDKPLVGFNSQDTVFGRNTDATRATDYAASAKKAGRSKVGQPKKGIVKFGQGKRGLRTPAQ